MNASSVFAPTMRAAVSRGTCRVASDMIHRPGASRIRWDRGKPGHECGDAVESITEIVTGFGMKGVSGEKVAQEAGRHEHT
jgi:hypothetical protein